MSSKVAIYARVSTSNHGQDVKVQTRDLEQFAQARGWQLIDSTSTLASAARRIHGRS